MGKEVKFEILSIDENNKSFTVRWFNDDGEEKVLNYNLPEPMMNENITKEQLIEHISSRAPRDMIYNNKKSFPSNLLQEIKKEIHSVNLKDRESKLKEENDEDL